MRKEEVAEFLLARFTTGERAVAIVGDLLETRGSRVQFWISVSKTLLAVSLTFWLGILLAVAAEIFFVWAFNRSATAAHPVGRVATRFGWCMAILLMTAAYSSLRYGLFAPVTKLSGALALSCSIGVCFRWVPAVVPVCWIFAGVVIGAAVVSASGRTALLSTLMAVVAAGVGGLVVVPLAKGFNGPTASLWGAAGFLVLESLLVASGLSVTRSTRKEEQILRC